jgi:hypothetical protein
MVKGKEDEYEMVGIEEEKNAEMKEWMKENGRPWIGGMTPLHLSIPLFAFISFPNSFSR